MLLTLFLIGINFVGFASCILANCFLGEGLVQRIQYWLGVCMFIPSILVLAFVFGAKLSLLSSVAIASAIVFSTLALKDARLPNWKYSPTHIEIGVAWNAMYEELGIARGDGDHSDSEPSKWPRFSFTILSYENPGDALVYWQGGNGFGSSIAGDWHSYSLREDWWRFSFSTCFPQTSGADPNESVVQFRLNVTDEWWKIHHERIRENAAVVFAESEHDGHIRLVLAEIPLLLFQDYSYATARCRPEKFNRSICAALERSETVYGWKRHEDGSARRFAGHRSATLTHRYFRISRQPVNGLSAEWMAESYGP